MGCPCKEKCKKCGAKKTACKCNKQQIMARDYKKEYKKFQSSDKAKKDRAKRNKARREAIKSGKAKKAAIF